MDYKVITGSSTTDFINQLQSIVLQGFSPVGDLHNSRAGQLIISVQKIPFITTSNIAVVIQPTNGQLEADCDALAQVGFLAHGAVLVKDGEYLVQLMVLQIVALPVANLEGITPYMIDLLTKADAVEARTYLGAGTSSLVLGEVAGTAKEGDYQPEVGDLSDATATGIALFKAASALEARNVIGAGTSNLQIGITAGTAKVGDYQPASTDITDASNIGRDVLTAASAGDARGAIGAGTSSLVLGTTVGTAKDGAYHPASTDITDSTVLGRQFITVADTAAAKALVPYVNEVYRGSFTTAGASISQNCVTNNVPQAVTYNAEAIANADLGTMNQATGVFTCAATFSCVISIAAQMQRASGILGSATWIIQLESSIDNGATWQPAIGSARRITLPAGDNNLLRVVDYTLSIATAAGVQLRLTQASDNVGTSIGLFASAAGNGMTTSAGIVFNIYSVL